MKKILLVNIFWLFVFPVLGQDEDDWEQSGSLEDARIEVVKDLDIDLPEAERNYQSISLSGRQQEAKDTAIRYRFTEYDFRLSDIKPRMRVMKIKQEKLDQLYSTYLKAGYGNYGTPYLEGYWGNKREGEFAYGAHARHFSSARGPVENSGMSHNQLDVYGKRMFDNVTLYGDLSYERNKYRFYGYDKALEVDGDSIAQTLNTYNINAGLKNANPGAVFDYEADFNYRFLDDALERQEGEFVNTSRFSYALDDSSEVLLDYEIAFSSVKEDTQRLNRNYYQFRPAYRFYWNEFNITAGFTIAADNDTTEDISNFHFYPRVNATIQPFGNQTTLFGGIEGGLEKNTYYSFLQGNRYLGRNLTLHNNNNTFELYAGLKGNINHRWSYKARVAWMNYKYLSFFINGMDTSRFEVAYDEGNTTVRQLTGELEYQAGNQFDASLRMDYYGYDVSELEEAWHRPSFKARINGRYNLYEKLFFNLDFYYLTGMTGVNMVSQETHTLKDITDLNAKIDYHFSPAFSLFVSVNNILNNNYERYLYYPNKGFNVIGGLSYAL